MKKLMTWNEVLELDLENMGKVANEIELEQDEKRRQYLNERLANATTHYEAHKSALKDGLACNYYRTTMS